MRSVRYAFTAWLPLAVAISGICGLILVSVQQDYRQSLNDPQVQMAEDAATALAAGEVPAGVVTRAPLIDISQSLAPWIAIYDESGMSLESTGELAGAPPKPPQGAFDAARSGTGKGTDVSGQNRISWESADGTRNAIVIQHVSENKGGFVVVGRNMREVESREQSLTSMIAMGWLALLVATLVIQIISTYLSPRPRQ